MKLILTRHGETEENKARIVQGHLPGTLSQLGIEQAKKVAQRLKEEKIDYIFSSDSARAVNTAKEIAKFNPDTPIEFTRELRERQMGDLEGKETIPNWMELKWDPEVFEKAGGEGLDKLFERASNLIKKTLNRFQRETILFVTHNGLTQTIITSILGKSWENIKEVEKQGNTAITIFEFDKNNSPTLKLMNSTEHLK